jgi:hypothetical protein
VGPGTLGTMWVQEAELWVAGGGCRTSELPDSGRVVREKSISQTLVGEVGAEAASSVYH